MTLAEFRKKHPNCQVGLPFPWLGLVMMIVCAVVVYVTGNYVYESTYAVTHRWKASVAPIGAALMGLSFLFGAGVSAWNILHVLKMRWKGVWCFAVSDTEAIFVTEEGESLVFPLAAIQAVKLERRQVTLTMEPGFPDEYQLRDIAGKVMNLSGEGPKGPAFVEALAPRLEKAAPDAKITRVED